MGGGLGSRRPGVSGMRLKCLVLAALSGGWLTAGGAQEFPNQELRERLCEQCPFDAPANGIRRDDFSSPNATVTVTADDMRNLGVVSVADMINQQSVEDKQDPVPASEGDDDGEDEASAASEAAESGAADD